MVGEGEDRIADDCLELFGRSSVTAARLAELIEKLIARATIFDLGCGAGKLAWT
jgi:predicted RNA methylase